MLQSMEMTSSTITITILESQLQVRGVSLFLFLGMPINLHKWELKNKLPTLSRVLRTVSSLLMNYPAEHSPLPTVVFLDQCCPTPIINPPQSAILGIHATKERPVVENGQIVIRPMNYLALSYDHRIIDGKEAVLSLVTIKEALEYPMSPLFES